MGKQKKKAATDARLAVNETHPEEDKSEQAAFHPPSRTADADKAEEAVALDESEGEAEEATGEGPAAKKKKKKKKKAAGSALVAAGSGGKGVPKYISDEEWAIWVPQALEATAAREL